MEGEWGQPKRELDEQHLAAFEALVLSQKPAEKPWEPVTDYSFEARKAIEGPHADIIVELFGKAARALDVGCGPHAVLVRLLRERGMSVFGMDRHFHDCAFTFVSDIAGALDHDTIQYDLVICREVLEHLTVRQIRKAIANLCALSSRFCYVTTRFANNPTHLLTVDTSDDLDPTHITMLNQTFMRVLFVLEGFKRRADLEAKLDWRNLGRVLVYERA